MFEVILWGFLGSWLLCGVIGHGVGKNISINCILLGRCRGDYVSPYTWGQELVSWATVLLGPIKLLVVLGDQALLREQVILTQTGVRLGLPHLDLQTLPRAMERAWSLGFRLRVPKECRIPDQAKER